MEKIQFDNLQSKKARIIIILAIILNLVGVFKPFNVFSEAIYKQLFVAGFLLYFIFFSRMFWLKNCVQWNKRGIVIKIDSWFGFGESLKFNDIKSINFEETTIELTLFGGRRKRIINVSHIVLADRQQLQQLLQKYTTRKKV